MRARPEDVERLRAAPSTTALLTAESGLPGPRANLPLAHAAAEALTTAQARALVEADDEYLALCGALTLGSRAEPGAREAAHDPRWRVREGVALGLQVLGRRDPMGFSEVLDAWRDDPDPLVQRARVAAVCEPSLLKDPALALLALEVCAEATDVVRAAPDRRDTAVRVLRQALGYGWSVAVAADPAYGLPTFRALEQDPDSDVAWIVRSNLGKARLRRLLER